MGEVIDLFERERYCKGRTCRRVDCDRHCWGCGAKHDSSDFGELPFCTACEIEFNTDEEVDLHGFWDPPAEPGLAPERRRRSYGHVSLEDLLRDVGHQWLKENRTFEPDD